MTEEVRAPTHPYDQIELAGKVVALTTALLPGAGFLARAVAFEIQFHDSGWAVPMAWSDPLPDLAFTGLTSVVLASPAVLLIWLLLRYEQFREAEMKRSPRFGRRVLILMLGGLSLALVVNTVVLIGLIVAAPSWPLSLFAIASGWIVILGSRLSWRGQAAKKFGDVWWVIVVAVLFAAIGNGITGILGGFIQVASYEFDPKTTSVLTDGLYQPLGDADGFLYLQKCGTSRIYVVNEHDVASVEPALHRLPVLLGPSLAQVILGATPTVGVYKC